MVDRNEGFRFDIYERVILPPDSPGIEHLEQLELLPHVEGIPGREQTELRGYLRLNAAYESADGASGTQTFVYDIPVEISLPVRRGSGMKQVGVQIDQFDVELVSSRSLNVTGVLSLSGWDAAAFAREAEQEDDDIVAVHGDDAETQRQDDQSDQNDQGEQEEPRTETQQQAAEANEAAEAADSGQASGAKEATWEHEQHEAAWPEENSELVNAQEHVEDADKQEMKVAFKPQAEEHADGTDAAGGAGSSKANNLLEWKSLFLSKDEQTMFRTVRICIVQKEETLQAIAQRYELNPRELELYNRLDDSAVSEGQALYIPGK